MKLYELKPIELNIFVFLALVQKSFLFVIAAVP